MSKQKKQTKHATAPQITNRRARFDYELGEEIVAGLVLTGQEVRAARDGHVQLKGAFVSIRNDELCSTTLVFLSDSTSVAKPTRAPSTPQHGNFSPPKNKLQISKQPSSKA